VEKITKDALEFVLESARNLHPREFTAHLRDDGGVITQIILFPASTYGEGFAQYRLDMMPIDRTIVGTFHSHPSRDYRPSNEDLHSFETSGRLHLIARYPYRGMEDVAAYDRKGRRIELKVV
jgi:proteasome lid subunit RPN8/RPN11